MTGHVLSIRVSRRAIGVAILADDRLLVTDGHHLSSAAGKAAPAAIRYVDRLMQSTRISNVVLEVPQHTSSSVTAAVVAALRGLLQQRGYAPIVLTKSELLAAYGQPPLRNRIELRRTVADFWPQLAAIHGQVSGYAVDAAAAALFGDVQLTFAPPTST